MKNLNALSLDEKYEYLQLKIYPHIDERPSGLLYIPATYSKKVAELLGGDYDGLSKTGKVIFKDDLTSERIFPENGFDKYSRL
jgi:hypothetical protein